MSSDITPLLDQVKNLSKEDLERFGIELPGKLNSDFLQSYAQVGLTSALSSLPKDKKAKAIKEAIQAQPESERNKLAEEVGESAIGRPGEKTRDQLWLIVVVAFATVLIGAFITLAFGVFIKSDGSVKPELILTMFMSVIGFLAGLFVPSPVANRGNGDGS